MSERIEKIIQDYTRMIMERTYLENQIKNFLGISESEMIESICFIQPDSERVQTSGVSDKTAHIAMSYRNDMARINMEWRKHLEKEHSILAGELLFFESAVKSLSGNLPEFVTDMVMNGLTWDTLADKYHISRTMVAKYRRKAISELDTLLAIHDKTMADFILS